MDDASDRGRSGSHRADLPLFLIYLLLYAGFMGMTAFAPDALAKPVIGGVNLAVAYGMGLILTAMLLAGVAVILRSGGAAR
jgi:uncharacterized membrane protein (DUF485 family)